MKQEEIEEELKSLADEKYKDFHSKLCPGTENIIGVRSPVLKKFAKQIAKEEGITYLNNAKDDYYEEILLQGLVIGFYPWKEIEDCLQALKKFIPKIDNWAICDMTAAGLKLTKKYPTQMWNFLESYWKSQKEFEIRFAVVMLLDFYITEEYIDRVLEIYQKINHEGYYVKMAVAWGISICFIKFPEKTKLVLQNNTLDNFTHNKAIQKIIESYRVDPKTKELLKKWKRK